MPSRKKRPSAPFAALFLDALNDLERAVEGITAAEAKKQVKHFSSISWIITHLAQHIDSWVLGSLAGQPKNAYLANAEFSRGGTGEAVAGTENKEATAEVIRRARRFLQTVSEADLTRQSPYQGSIESLRGKPVNGNYRLARLIVHIYYHIGDINAIRSVTGHTVPDFPGLLPSFLDATTQP